MTIYNNKYKKLCLVLLISTGITQFIMPINVSAENTSAQSRFSIGPYNSIQVNVNALGENIIGDSAAETSIATHPNNPNNIVIGWRHDDGIPPAIVKDGWAYSFDRGVTWTFPGMIGASEGRTDPVLDIDAEGNFYYQTLRLEYGTSPNGGLTRNFGDIEIFKSIDGGKSWQAPVFSHGILGDKNWVAIDRTGGIGHGHIYTFWRSGSNPNHFTRSTNQGVSFEAPTNVPLNPGYGTLTVGPEGNVYGAGRIEFGGFVANGKLVVDPFLFTKSVNAKDASVTPVFTSHELEMGGSAVTSASRQSPNKYSLFGNVSVATDHSQEASRGNVYVLASLDPPGDDPLDVHLIRSTDGGNTWSAPIRVNDDASSGNSWQWFGAHAVAPNSRIDVVWYDTRNSNDYKISELFYAYSWDAGETWHGNTAVSPPFNTHVVDEASGDYIHFVSDKNGADVAYAATFNGELDVYYVRLFPDCNNNAISDVEDILQGTSQDADVSHIPDECEVVIIPGDLDSDGDVDRADMSIILGARNTPASGPDDPKDLDGDGTITALDARKLRLLCTRQRCASN